VTGIDRYPPNTVRPLLTQKAPRADAPNPARGCSGSQQIRIRRARSPINPVWWRSSSIGGPYDNQTSCGWPAGDLPKTAASTPRPDQRFRFFSFPVLLAISRQLRAARANVAIALGLASIDAARSQYSARSTHF
jgi:hypothetical protein